MEKSKITTFALPLLMMSMLAACGEEQVTKKEDKYAIPVETTTVMQGDVSSFTVQQRP